MNEESCIEQIVVVTTEFNLIQRNKLFFFCISPTRALGVLHISQKWKLRAIFKSRKPTFQLQHSNTCLYLSVKCYRFH